MKMQRFIRTPRTLRAATLPLALAAALASGCASDRVVAPAEMRGGVLTEAYSHKTLYTFDKDPTNPPRSVCNADCAAKWPPYRPTAGERDVRDFTVIKRDDGSLQWAYKGKPLYTFVGDTKTGDKAGDGVNGVWHVVK
jgi:predicted lipoprotein with Yx(FWY)xxD motif